MSKNALLGGVKGLFPEGDPSLSVLKRAPTIATQFKGSMSALMKNLLAKNPNYIRFLVDCIKLRVISVQLVAGKALLVS